MFKKSADYAFYRDIVRLADNSALQTRNSADNHINFYPCLVVLGGNGSHKTANLLSEEGLNVVTLPKTIDNDLWGTDMTFGFQSAVDVATRAIDCIHTTAASHGRVFIVDVNFEDDFVSAGVNQVRHRLMISVVVNATLCSMTESTPICIVTDIPLAETVISGDVPVLNTQPNENLK